MDMEFQDVESAIYYPNEDFWQRPVQFLENTISEQFGIKTHQYVQWVAFTLVLYALFILFFRPLLRPLLYRYAYGDKKRK